VDDVFQVVKRLEKFPESGSKVPERNRADLREILFGAYRIVYKLKNANAFIITIIHCKQDYTPE
jgi:plasmid stabilization system protein ParE